MVCQCYEIHNECYPDTTHGDLISRKPFRVSTLSLVLINTSFRIKHNVAVVMVNFIVG